MADRDLKPENVERLIASLHAQAQAIALLAQGELDTPIPVCPSSQLWQPSARSGGSRDRRSQRNPYRFRLGQRRAASPRVLTDHGLRTLARCCRPHHEVWRPGSGHRHRLGNLRTKEVHLPRLYRKNGVYYIDLRIGGKRQRISTRCSDKPELRPQ
jgi:hypothetical protein